MIYLCWSVETHDSIYSDELDFDIGNSSDSGCDMVSDLS
jgi:hypothetical protein